MEVIETPIEGVVILEPKVFGDERGYFLKVFHRKNLTKKFVKRFLCRTTSRSRLMEC